MNPKQYKINQWFDSKKCQPAGVGLDVLYNGRWCHVLNETQDGPMLYPTVEDAHRAGRRILERARARMEGKQ